MRMAVLQHVPFEGPAGIADWAELRGVDVAVTHLYRGMTLPKLSDFDMLTIMGGPMSVNDQATIPWLAPEVALVRDAIASGKVVLGVCLGSQMIAKALGGKVYSGPTKEIGWFPVQSTAAGTAYGLPERFTPFHWHGETFDLPDQAHLLASTAVVPNQAFAIDTRIVGLQFHIEATPESVKALIENVGHDIGSGAFEQSPETILDGLENCAAIRQTLHGLLDRLTASGLGRT